MILDKNILPKDWKWVKLGDILSVSSGKGIKVNSLQGGKHPVYGGNGLNGYHSDFFIEEPKLIIGRVGVKCGVTHITKPKSWVTDNALIVEPKQDAVDIEFLKLKLGFENLNKLSVSTAQPVISGSKIYAYEILLPSKPAQQAIVSKIEELFSELDKGIEQLKIAQQQLKIYRQAVLKWAFEGKLTNDNIKEGNLPKGWKIKKIEEVAECLDSKRRPVNKEERLKMQGNIPYYGANGRTGWINDHLFDEPLILVVEDETFVGRELPFSYKIAGKSWVNNHAHILKPKEGLDINYLNYQLAYYPFLPLTTGTTGRKKLTKNALMNAPLKICIYEEQKQIVEEIESRLSVADKVEDTIKQSLQQADALRQSILKKAFEGKLVATDTIETIKQIAKIIPLERKVLAGKIIHLLHDDKYFGLTKFQKILYLVENYSEVQYETNFIQERAGPYDKEFTIAFRKEMQEKDWIQEEQKGNITKFILGDSIGSLIKDYAIHFRKKGKKIVFVIQQLKDKSTHEAELIATLYAVWNNRLIKKKPIKIELLVEDFFNWSAKKKEEFQKEEVVSTYKWMKKIMFIPSGFGKTIEPVA